MTDNSHLSEKSKILCTSAESCELSFKEDHNAANQCGRGGACVQTLKPRPEGLYPDSYPGYAPCSRVGANQHCSKRQRAWPGMPECGLATAQARVLERRCKGVIRVALELTAQEPFAAKTMRILVKNCAHIRFGISGMNLQRCCKRYSGAAQRI
eukprot:2707188-Rhodomonas_salina.2